MKKFKAMGAVRPFPSGFLYKMGSHHHVADAVDLAVQLVILAVCEPLDNGFGAHLEYQ